MACSSSKDQEVQEEDHQIHFAAATGQEGRTLAADLGWIGTGKVKAKGLQSWSIA